MLTPFTIFIIACKIDISRNKGIFFNVILTLSNNNVNIVVKIAKNKTLGDEKMLHKLGEDFLSNLEKNKKSECTLRNYRRNLIKFFAWYLKSEEKIKFMTLNEIKAITSEDIDKFKAWMEEEKGYKRTYINNIIASLTSFYKYLGKIDISIKNEARVSGTMVEHRSEPVFLEFKEAENLLKVVEIEDKQKTKEINLRDKLIINLFLNTGLRCNELCNLKFKNMVEEDNYIVFFGKGGKERGLYLSDKVMELYKQWKEIRLRMTNVCKEYEEYIFLSRKKTIFSNTQINRIIKNFCNKAGIDKKISSHKLRHSFATIMLKEGKRSIEEVADLLGHSSTRTTLRYTHITDDTKRLTRYSNPLFS